MTPVAVLAAVALRAATAHCPALADQARVTLVVETVRDCGGHGRALGCYRGGLTIEVDPTAPRRLIARIVAHELGHVCSVLERGDWSERAANRFADTVVPR